MESMIAMFGMAWIGSLCRAYCAPGKDIIVLLMVLASYGLGLFAAWSAWT